jgi:hypothetical protein
VTVSNDGKSFTGRENIKVVDGLNPYDPSATGLFTATGLTLSATKIEVNTKSPPVKMRAEGSSGAALRAASRLKQGFALALDRLSLRVVSSDSLFGFVQGFRSPE